MRLLSNWKLPLLQQQQLQQQLQQQPQPLQNQQIAIQVSKSTMCPKNVPDESQGE